jgi:hypothetical protein
MPMKVEFACPSCGATGSVDAALAGRRARCKGCGHQFTIPREGEVADKSYALEGPAEPMADTAYAEPESAFVPTRGDAPVEAAPRRAKPPARRARPRRRTAKEGSAWKWLIRGMIALVVGLVGVALFAPKGVILAGCSVVLLGMLMVVVGYGAGAYGAFCEDSLYGMLYLIFPLYAGYYLVTRWDDLWPWFTCSTSGVVLVMIGTGLLQWAGMGV